MKTKTRRKQKKRKSRLKKQNNYIFPKGRAKFRGNHFLRGGGIYGAWRRSAIGVTIGETSSKRYSSFIFSKMVYISTGNKLVIFLGSPQNFDRLLFSMLASCDRGTIADLRNKHELRGICRTDLNAICFSFLSLAFKPGPLRRFNPLRSTGFSIKK